MSKKYLLLCILPFLFAELNAKKTVDCRIATADVSMCNPYARKFIVAKKIQYEKEEPKLIISKTLPKPKKQKIKVITVIDMIEKHIKIEDPIRYEGSKDSSLKQLHIESQDSSSISLEEELNIRRNSTIEKIKNLDQKSQINILAEKNVTIELPNIYTFNDLNKSKISVVKLKVNENNLTKKQVSGIYKVTSGDSLSRIARRFYMKTSDLMAINNIKKGDKLKIGKELIIHLEQNMIDTISKAEYIIESGDTITSIAKKFDIEKSDILKYNKLKKASKIKIGQKLVLPFPYKIAQLERARKARIAALKRDKKIRGNLKRKLRVTATAYTSHGAQTDSTPFLAAWNNRLRPGMKAIAVSRDMLTRYGLRNGSKVRIAGLSGYYTVRDKMNKRYKKRIDIYMGMDRRRALRWGRRSVIIYY